jgi:hypothetical protein
VTKEERKKNEEIREMRGLWFCRERSRKREDEVKE